MPNSYTPPDAIRSYTVPANTDPVDVSAWFEGFAVSVEDGLAGAVVQVVNVQTGAVATGTTQIPNDDTIPQITEGDQYMSLAITPISAASTLIIESVWFGASSANVTLTVALFVGSTADALAVSCTNPQGADSNVTVPLTHKMTAGVTTELTFRIRAGGNSAGTTTFNGRSAGRFYGGVAASSITITEITP